MKKTRHDTRANCFRTRFRIVAVNGGTFPFSSLINISKGRRSCSREKASREKKSAPSFCSENSVESRCLLFSSSSQARPFSSLSAFHRLSRQCVSEIYLLAWTTTTTTTVSLSVNLASQNALAFSLAQFLFNAKCCTRRKAASNFENLSQTSTFVITSRHNLVYERSKLKRLDLRGIKGGLYVYRNKQLSNSFTRVWIKKKEN